MVPALLSILAFLVSDSAGFYFVSMDMGSLEQHVVRQLCEWMKVVAKLLVDFSFASQVQLASGSGDSNWRLCDAK